MVTWKSWRLNFFGLSHTLSLSLFYISIYSLLHYISLPLSFSLPPPPLLFPFFSIVNSPPMHSLFLPLSTFYILTTVTTDVSHVTVSLNCPILNITCHFWSGSNALGCYISLTPQKDQSAKVINGMISRSTNQSVEAIGIIMLTQQSCCYHLAVYDWEEDDSLGLIPIPLSSSCDIITSVTSNNSSEGID